MTSRPDQPNLLFIFTDQQRADTMAAYGNHVIKTPHLNAFADQSFVFQNAYVSQPVCTPSRSTIMTGTYPHMNGCTSNNVALHRDAKTLPQMVTADYRTGYYGKWHLGNELRAQHGFDEWLTIEDLYRPHYRDAADLDQFSDYHQYLVEQGYEPDIRGDDSPGIGLGRRNDDVESASTDRMVFSRPFAAKLPAEHTKAAFLGRSVEQFVRDSADDERPFILYANFLEPHSPFMGPNDKLHTRRELNEGPAFLKSPDEDAAALHRVMADSYAKGSEDGEDLSKAASWRRLRAKYFGLVSLVDTAVGGILQALEDSGQAENTIVVFTSEHGEMMGDHRLLHKAVMYREAMRVPLLVRVPWLAEEGRVIEGSVSLVDLVPTILQLLGEEVPGHLQGDSRVPALWGDDDLAENDVVVQWNGSDGRPDIDFATEVPHDLYETVKASPWRSIITPDGWKLNLSPVDRCELFNLNSDPHEQVNVFEQPAQRDRVRDLVSRIRLWQERHKDYTQVLPQDWD